MVANYIVPGTMFCNICYSVFEASAETKWENIERPHHSSLESFQSSCDQNCCICTRLNGFYSNVDGGHQFYETVILLDWEGGMLRVGRAEDMPPHGSFQRVFHLKEISEHVLSLSRKSLQSNDANSDDIVRLARHWLDTCLIPICMEGDLQHEPCRNHYPPSFYPARLLDISGHTAVLVDGSVMSSGNVYATISHCWGNIPFETLTESNIAKFRKGLPISWFPATFRDLISFAKKLEIRHIWIDCYCIIQSGQTDSERLVHIAQMKDVYTNSVLNLAADYSIGPFSGCVLDREQTDRVATTFALPFSNRLYDCYPGEVLQQNGPRCSPLLKRAWVMQERQLAPRMLHFTKSGLFWECNSWYMKSDQFPNGDSMYNSVMSSFSLGPMRSEYLFDEAPRTWASLVEIYSRLQLSRPFEDKLVALGGIAEQMAEKLQERMSQNESRQYDVGQYVAGLFRADLLWQLPWSVDLRNLQQPIQKPSSPWRAPSWSWAALDSPVEFESSIAGNYIAEIESIDLQLVDETNPYGALHSASMTIDGRPLEATIDRESTYKPYFLNIETFLYRLSDGSRIYCNFDTDELLEDTYTTLDDTVRCRYRSRLSLLPVRRCGILKHAFVRDPDSGDWGEHDTAVVGLILIERDDGTCGRAGSFWRPGDQSWGVLFEDAEETLVKLV